MFTSLIIVHGIPAPLNIFHNVSAGIIPTSGREVTINSEKESFNIGAIRLIFFSDFYEKNENHKHIFEGS